MSSYGHVFTWLIRLVNYSLITFHYMDTAAPL
jgi:hypothetical protein